MIFNLKIGVKGMINRRYIIGIFLVLLMTCVAISAVDAVSAAKYKKIDSGQYSTNQGYLIKYNTVYNGKIVKTTHKLYGYDKNNTLVNAATFSFNLKKVSKKKIKGVAMISGKGFKTKKNTAYEKTKLSVKSYYMKSFKSQVKSSIKRNY